MDAMARELNGARGLLAGAELRLSAATERLARIRESSRWASEQRVSQATLASHRQASSIRAGRYG